MHPRASARLPSPRAMAVDRSPLVVNASAVPRSTFCTPLTEMLMFCPGADPPPPPPPGFFDVDGLGDDAEDESVVDVSERDGGLAPATLGNAVVATIPAPIPSATANAPTRPMY